MGRGRPPKSNEEKAALGTLQVSRTRDSVTYIEPPSSPVMPDWLTDAGKAAWLDNIGRVMQATAGNELDSDYFGHFCNTHGACIEAWRLGVAPPVAVLREVTMMMKNLRIAGTMSRATIVKEHQSASSNPFARQKPNNLFAQPGKTFK